MKAKAPAAICAAFLTCAFAPNAGADVVKEAPWSPLAKVYLFGIFVSGLRPIDWTGIEQRYASRRHPDQGGKSAYDLLAPVDAFAKADHAAAIRAAILKRDRAALRSVSTRALSRAARHHLHEAGLLLGTKPGGALRHTLAAQELYRPFAGFIRQADPEGFRRLGMAWLELTTLAGRKLGRTGPERSRARQPFDRAARTIEDYLIASYEAPPRSSIARRGPIPDRGRGREPGWKPAPWLPPDANILDQSRLPRLVLNFEQRGIDERELFLVAYGDMLFDSPEIFGEPARGLSVSCSGCHNRSEANRAFFIPGLSRRAGGVDVDSSHFNPSGNDMRFDPIDIPSLRGIQFMAPYGRNGRTASLRQFTRNVIVGEFGGAEPTPLMLDALVVYMNEFDFLPAPYLDREARLNGRASESAKRGEALFNRPFPRMGGRSCAGCHIPSGNFLDGRRHDIGSGQPATKFARDGAFDTPTLLGIAHTAPYFHDGSLATLGGVVSWFDTRFALGLDDGQRKDLTAYLEAVGTGEEPFERFEGKNTRFRLDFGELSTFLSTLDELIRRRDGFHARLLIRTVSRDLSADASGLTDVRLMPAVYDLAGLLEGIDRVIAAGDWARAKRLWAEYKAKEKRLATKLY